MSDEAQRKRRRLPAITVPLLLTAAMVVAAFTLVDDDASTSSSTTSDPPRRLTIVGDIGSSEAGAATLAAMGRRDADVHIAVGDLSYAGPGSAPAWCKLVRDAVGDAPFQIVAGNHEEDTGEDGRIAEFEQCLPDRMDSSGLYGREYYFDLGRLVRVILISPDLTIDGEHYYYGERSPNERWLEAVIDGARDARIRWIVVGMHKPCISVGQYYCDVYQDLFSLLIEKRVDLVVSGHDHGYQRSKQLQAPRPGCDVVIVDSFDPDCVVDDGADAAYERGAGTVFVVSGAGGGELYELNPADPEAPYFVTTMGAGPGSRHGFLELEASDERLTARFVGSTAGTYEDAFTIEST